MKKSYGISILLMVCAATSLFAQASIRKLPNSINHPSINVYAPYVSFDGDALIFISDNAEDYALTPFYTSRQGVGGWKDPVVLPKNVNTRMNHLYGFTLGPDGRTLYLTTLKSPGIGGFDIAVSELKGTSWSEPKNLALPINSKLHDASASLTPDGKTMYFMRCEKMDQKTADRCKIFVVKKKANGQWDEPQELPATINTGNSQTPRIMADGETLIFSSNHMGGKGGMDLFVSKFSGGEWSSPKSLDFVNTPKDDQYVSVTALGRYLLRDSPGARKSELVEYLIPNHLRPRGLMKVDGKILSEDGTTIPAFASVLDLSGGKRIYNNKIGADGIFTLYIPEGSKYVLSVDPEQNNFSFYSRLFDLTSEKIPQIEKVTAQISPVREGSEIPLNLVQFKPSSSELLPSSAEDLKRLARVIKSNPALKFEIQVLMTGYQEDVSQSSPDLTEFSLDSIHTLIDDIDSLGQLYKRDSLLVKTTYHNNRTISQAKAIINFLVREGVPASNMTFFGNAKPEAIIENRSITVKALARR